MKYRTKQLILSACSLALLGGTHFALADTVSDTETLLNWAEKTYPQFFPSHQTTQSIEPWLFRHYPEANIYAGVNKHENNAYVMGGPWGNEPTLIDTLPNIINHIADTGGNGGIAACNTANVPAGLVFTQKDNIVNVTTNGECIEIPSNTNFCETPKQSAETGISVLSASSVATTAWSGITLSIPFDPSTFSASNVKHCTIHAPAEQANLIVNTDICMDMTKQLESQLMPLIAQGLATVTPPITLTTQSTFQSQQVADCFATDATTIYNAVTQEMWIKGDGGFTKINN
ncbi:hypothetical protein [Nitrosomonas sp. Nm132]|uniref:hypothetical protein n=1 Tax=Nitrosomonas sp. Nm132 TaxID=1881053 RepID=UPI0008836027|nr:hypothetical protein [Nitrosomonas sp. Nm132]SDH13770.1 hypothetical protein SAMN05428952_100630 [Nitrosomonas sp. Nm132]